MVFSESGVLISEPSINVKNEVQTIAKEIVDQNEHYVYTKKEISFRWPISDNNPIDGTAQRIVLSFL
jgi:hypothetical protein